MIVERIWAANELRNYHYVVACGETGEALVIDPLDWRACLERAKERGWTITQIVNTHEHRDHTAGNAALVQATGAKLWRMRARAATHRRRRSRRSPPGDVIRVGRSVELECLDTPGHTLSARLPAGACRWGGAVFGRHALQRRGRQLPRRWRSGAAVRDLRATARAAAGQHAHLSRPRLPAEQPALHPPRRARQRGRRRNG